MSAALFLVGAVPPGGRFVLDGDEGHHAATVARLRPGEVLLLGDGRGTMAEATVVEVGRGTLEVELRRRWFDEPAAARLVVAQGIAKGDRGELAVQAMTEVGVDEIVPWAAARSVVRWREERGDRSRQRWVDTAREATKQARRAWLPSIAPAQTHRGRRRPARVPPRPRLVLHEEARTPLSTVALPARRRDPAGGRVRRGASRRRSWRRSPRPGRRRSGSGPTVLRTSTAGVAALAVLNARLGRW